MDAFFTIPKPHYVENPWKDRPPESPSRQEIMSILPPSERPVMKAMVQVSSVLIVKYGTDIQIGEARNMLFAATISGVRRPRVFDAWEVVQDDHTDQGDHDSDGDTSKMTYIVMEYIEGKCLADVWQSLDEIRRQTIMQELYAMVKALHNNTLDSPGPIGGGKSKGFYITGDDAGPFHSQRDMELWFDSRLKVCKEFRRAPLNQPSFIGCFQPLVMCHLDLHTHNMIIDSQGCLWLLDWDRAGAYPYYFEEAFFIYDRNNHDFSEALLDMLRTPESAEQIRKIEYIGFALSTGRLLEPRQD